MKKRIIALLLITVLAVTSLLACSKDEPKEPGMTKVVLSEVAHSIFYAPMYVAIEEDYFAEEGIEVVTVQVGNQAVRGCISCYSCFKN